MRFSVVIPVYNRPESVLRSIRSVFSQTYKGDFEIIVVDDGSTDETARAIHDHYSDGYQVVQYVRHEKNLGKTFARNTGLRMAKGDFVCELDSDDEYHSHYLQTFSDLIDKYPDLHVFTCGAAVYNHKSDSFHTRPAFAPIVGERFRSGHIGTGSFVYRRSLAPYIPESAHPYGGDDSFSALAQRSNPEIESLYGKTDQGQWRPLGNPFGDDYVKFFMLTRENAVASTDLPLYLQNVRP